MPLVDLKTNLKSIKYGLDRPNMGSSKEPFITKPIPDERPVDIPDFILRDGALRRGFEDVSRLTQLFTTVRGLRFIANTNLLAAQNPKIPGAPRNLYLPTSTIAQVGVNAIGTHLNLLGETPIDLPSTPINIGNFSFNIGGDTYFTEYKNNYSDQDSNRLVILTRKKIGLKGEEEGIGDFYIDPTKAIKYGIALSNDRLISNYLGGPGAGLTGLNTTINRTEFTVGSKGYSGEDISTSKSNSRNQIANSKTSLNLTNLLGASSEYFTYTEVSGIQVPDPDPEFLGINPGDGSQLKTYGPQDNNSTLSINSDKDSLISSSLQTSFNESNNSKTSINGYKLLGASIKEGISDWSDAGSGSVEVGFNYENGTQTKLYGPQDSNTSLSKDSNKDSLISSSLQTSFNESNNSKSSINGNKLLGASLKEGISDQNNTGSIKTGFDADGKQTKLYGPQDSNTSLSKDPNKDLLIASSRQVSSGVTSLKTLSSYKNLLGASKVYDERNSVKESSTAPFTEPEVDKSGFNNLNQQLKRYGPLDNNIVPDKNYLDYRYQGTPALRENISSSLYEIGRQGKVDMLVTPNSPYGQTFFPNYAVINSPFIGDKNFNDIRNKKDQFNRSNTEKLNLSKFSGTTQALTPFLKGADGKIKNDTGGDETTNEGQLYPFILNLIDAESPDTNQYLYWQAYIESFSDKINADYENYEYPGYGTSFHRYKSFSREINLDFTIEVPHPDQMVIIYRKLEELIRHLAPNYSQGGYLRGNFVKLTFGDYLRDTPCILKGFTIEPIFDGGFDIGRSGYGSRGQSSGYQLPKVLKLSGFNFIVLADNNNQLIRKSSTFISNKEHPLN